MTLRVLYVESSAGGIGGSHHSLWTLVSHLDRSLVAPEVLCFGDDPFWDRFREQGVPVHVWPTPPQRRAAGAGRQGTAAPASETAYTVPAAARYRERSRLRRAVGSLLQFVLRDAPLAWRLAAFVEARRVALLHANDRLGSNRFVALAGWLSGRPVVQHERLVGPYRWTDVWLSSWLAAALCVSAEVARRVREEGHRGRLEVLPNAVDPPAATPAIRDPDQPRVGIVGRLVPWKGQDLFLSAMSRIALQDARPRFIIVGQAPPDVEEYGRALRRRAEESPLSGRVEFTGYVASPGKIISGLAVLVVASRSPEPFGRTVVEAMSLGVPVVAPAAGGPAEILADGGGLLYPPNDEISLAAAVVELLQDPARARALGEEGRRRARRHFHPAAHARAVERIYAGIMAGA